MAYRTLLLLWLSLLLAGVGQAEHRPNIVVVIGDDHAWPYSGFMGDPVVKTPTLDRLADEGTVFTNLQLPASVCRPSLQTVLSGLHPAEWDDKLSALRRDQRIPPRTEVVSFRTLPRELARSGYRSWEGGKMWEGRFDQAGFTGGMAKRAFTDPFKIDGSELGREGWDPARCGEGRTGEGPCPALEPVRTFLDEHAEYRDAAGNEAPFFLWFAPKLPHTPLDPPWEFILPYLASPGLSIPEIIYFAQVTRMDAVIGELLRELDERGLRKDTLVVFFSDNGWEIGQGVLGRNVSHGKRSLYELGMRSPLLFHWPGKIPRGVRRDDIVHAEDLFPTLLDYGRAEPVADRRGRSLREAIRRGADVGHERYVSYFRAGQRSGFFVRRPEWRYLAFLDGREELYQIQADPLEQDDLSASFPVLVDQLRAEIPLWEEAISTAPPRLEIAGQLVGPDSLPIAGASLRLQGAGPDLRVLTDALGQFRFQHLPHGRYHIARGPELLIVVGPVDVQLPMGRVGSYGRLIALPALSGLQAGRSSIRGRLRTRQGVGIADTTVTLRHETRGIEIHLRTGPDGEYLAEHLPEGRYRVEATVDPRFGHPEMRLQVHPERRHYRDLVAWEKRPPSA